jgi:hypothetical protein
LGTEGELEPPPPPHPNKITVRTIPREVFNLLKPILDLIIS